jgi:hypothetical protein
LGKIKFIPEQLQGITRFNVNISGVEPINDRFSKCTVKILYPGFNRNGVYISKEVANEMSKTLANIPIVGEYVETIEDFKDHGGKIEITTDDIKFIQTTKPYGFVPEETEISWQNIKEDDGTVREYLTCTGYLWTGKYPEAAKVIEESRPQSMELVEDTLEGVWKQENGELIFHITQAEFSALCILGEDVPPAFESANIGSYYISNPISFQKKFGRLLRDYEESLPKVSNFSAKESTKEKEEGGQNMFQFNLNLEEDSLRHQIYNILNPVEEDKREWKYSIASVTNDSVLYVEESTGTGFYQDYRLTTGGVEWIKEPREIVIGEIDNTEFNDLKEKYTTLEEQHEELKRNYNEIKEKSSNTEEFAALQEENKALKEFKEKVETKEKEAVITQFKVLLTEEDINPFEEKIAEYTKEQLEEKLSVIAIKKANFSMKEKDDDFIPNDYQTSDNDDEVTQLIKKHTS